MKIVLQYPYTEEFTHAYLILTDDRNTVCL